MAKKETVSSKVEHKSEYIWCIQNPRITEKATKLAEGNVYTFDVHKDANKQQVQFAIENLYNVHPTKIRMVTIPSVTVMKKNIKGRSRGGKKAYVHLKKGDTITLF